MAIQFVGGATASKVGATSGNSTITLASGLTGGIASAVSAGDLVVAIFGTGSTANRTLAITDGTTAYTLIGSAQYANDTYDTNLRCAYKFMGATPDASTTFGPTGSTADAGAMAVYVFRGVDPTTPLDVAAIQATALNTSRVVPPDITPSTAGAYPVVIGAAAHNGGTDTFTSSDLTGFLTKGQNDTNDVTIGIGHQADWSSGATNFATWGHSQADSTSFSWAATTIALRPAPPEVFPDVDPADIILLALNENGSNGSTTFVDQSSYGHTINVVNNGGSPKWSNAQTLSSSNTFLAGNGVGNNKNLLGIGEGGSSVINLLNNDFAIEGASYITAFRDSAGHRQLLFSMGISADGYNCMEIACGDWSDFFGAGSQVLDCLLSTNPGGNTWDISDGIGTFNSGLTNPAGVWFYWKLSRVGSQWKIRTGPVSSGYAYAVGANATFTSSATLGDLSSMGSGQYAANISGGMENGGNEGFDGYTAFVRMTVGTSAAALHGTDLIPDFPYPTDSGVTGAGSTTAQSSAVSGSGASSSLGTGSAAVQSSSIAGSGVSSTIGTGALAAQSSVVSGTGAVGTPAITGTGDLASQASAVAGAGVSSSIGTGALIAQSATVAGVGISASSGAGALSAQSAAVSGAGTVSSQDITGTGAIASATASVAGTGTSSSTGTGAVQAQSASVAGVGVSSSAGTGALSAQSSAIDGAGTSASTGTGALSAQAASVSGAGTVGFTEITGSGALASQSSAVDGAGISASAGSGALTAQVAQVDGTGTIGTPAITGTGVLVAQSSSLDGAGVSASVGAGTLSAQSAQINSIGITLSVGDAVLVAQASSISGTGTVADTEITGTGMLQAQVSTVAGTGAITINLTLSEAAITALAAAIWARELPLSAQSAPYDYGSTEFSANDLDALGRAVWERTLS